MTSENRQIYCLLHVETTFFCHSKLKSSQYHWTKWNWSDFFFFFSQLAFSKWKRTTKHLNTHTHTSTTFHMLCCCFCCCCDWKHILSDGAIDVRDDDFIVPVPQVNGPVAAARPLVLGGDAKGHVIRALLQLQTGLVTGTTVKASQSTCEDWTCTP